MMSLIIWTTARMDLSTTVLLEYVYESKIVPSMYNNHEMNMVFWYDQKGGGGRKKENKENRAIVQCATECCIPFVFDPREPLLGRKRPGKVVRMVRRVAQVKSASVEFARKRDPMRRTAPLLRSTASPAKMAADFGQDPDGRCAVPR